MNKHLISLLLAALMLTPLYGCSEPEKEQENDKQTQTTSKDTLEASDAEETTVEEEDVQLKPNIPETADFNGDEIVFLHWYQPDWEETVRHSRDIFAENLNGEAINDTVYYRNLNIEENYNVKIVLDLEQHGKIQNLVSKQITSGDTRYDVVYPVLSQAPGLILKSYFHNLYNVPYIDFDKPWWDSNSVNSLSTNGILPLVSTSINVNDKDATAAIAFNKEMAAAYNLENLYDCVREGTWTYAKLSEMAQQCYNDTNGDGTMTPDDIYGFLGGRDVIDSLWHGSGSLFVTKDESDTFKFTFGTERDIDAAVACVELVNQEWFFNHHKYSNQSDIFYRQLFETGHGLFFWMRLDDVTNMRAGDTEFGILPNPKFDEAQEKYYSLVSQHTTGLLSIPISCAGAELEELGLILEAMAAGSQYTLIPKYIEQSLKTKYSRDEESGEMLDIIINNRVFDPMNIYSFASFGDALMDAGDAHNTNIASIVQSKLKTVNAAIDKTLKALIQNEG